MNSLRSSVQWIFPPTMDPAPWWSQAGRSRKGSAHRGRPEFGAARSHRPSLKDHHAEHLRLAVSRAATAESSGPSPPLDVEESPTSASTAGPAPVLQLWCRLRLKSMPTEKALKVQPGTGDTFKL